MTGKAWTRGKGLERKSERLPAVRVSPAERLRVLEAAERLGLGEAEAIRRALAAGVAELNKEKAE